jgi:hypothetical protein
LDVGGVVAGLWGEFDYDGDFGEFDAAVVIAAAGEVDELVDDVGLALVGVEGVFEVACAVVVGEGAFGGEGGGGEGEAQGYGQGNESLHRRFSETGWNEYLEFIIAAKAVKYNQPVSIMTDRLVQ